MLTLPPCGNRLYERPLVAKPLQTLRRVRYVPEAAAPVRDEHMAEQDIFATVYRQMRALSGNTQDLDDLVQTAMEQVLRSVHRFEGRARLSTWTYRICYLTWLKHHRWHRRWLRRFSLSADLELPVLVDPALSAAEALEAEERLQRLRGTLALLPPKQRAVVTLHDLEGLSIEQIAAITGANVLTARSRLRDGRRRLLRSLSRDSYFGDDPKRGRA